MKRPSVCAVFAPIPFRTEAPGGRLTVSAGTVHTCAVATDGRVYCWGFGDLGALGNGSSTSSLRPVAVAGDPVAVQAMAAVQQTALLQGLVIKLEVELQGTIGDPTAPPEHVDGLVEEFFERHWLPFACQSTFVVQRLRPIITEDSVAMLCTEKKE